MRARDVRPISHLPSIESVFSTVYGKGVGQSRPEPEPIDLTDPKPVPPPKRQRVLTDAFETDLTGPNRNYDEPVGEDIFDVDKQQQFVDLTKVEPTPLQLSKAIEFSHIRPDDTYRQLNFDPLDDLDSTEKYDLSDKIKKLGEMVGENCTFFGAFKDHAEHFTIPVDDRVQQDSAKYDNKSLHLLEYQGVPVAVAQVKHYSNGRAEIKYLCANMETHFGGGEAMVKHIADMVKDKGEDGDGSYLLNLEALPSATPSYLRMGLKFKNRYPRNENLPEMYTDHESPLKSDPADKIPVGKFTKKQLKARKKKQEEAEEEEWDYHEGRINKLVRPQGVYTRDDQGFENFEYSHFGIPEEAPDSGYPNNGYRDKNGKLREVEGGSTYKQREARRFKNFMHHKVVSKKQAKKYL